MQVYMVISESVRGKAVVGTFLEGTDHRIETFTNASDAIDLLDRMKHTFESTEIWYYIHSTEV